MNVRTRVILEHMLEDALDIIKFVEEIGNIDDFADNRLYHKAVIMSILNIGELAKKLPTEFKLNHKEIPWKNITGMRDIAAHGYHRMDDIIIWDVATHSIPNLIHFLQTQLNKES